MNPSQQVAGNPIVVNNMAHLLITKCDITMMADDPERVMEEMWQRATEVGSVLENILREPHGEPRWGLNE